MNRNRITGAARELTGRLREVAGGAGHEAALRAEDAYEDAVGMGRRLAGQARSQARELAGEAYGSGRELYGEGMRQLSRHASAHPLALVLAAGVAGAAIGWLLTQRRD